MKTVDIIALIATVTVSVILLATVLGTALKGEPLSDAKAEIVGRLVASFMAIISLYVGSKIKG